MIGAGHNGGPTLQPGAAWRRTCWSIARAELLPKLPLEVIRTRVRRAAEIGLDYRTYASVRATSGHDIVAFLFSTNALRMFRADQALAADRAARLRAVRGAGHILATHPPVPPGAARETLAGQGIHLLHAAQAPGLAQSWSDTSRHLRAMLAEARTAPDRVLLIGDTALERDWLAAGRLAGYLPADRYFGVT